MKYRKKPVEIEAIEFSGFNGQDVISWARECAPNCKEPVFHWIPDNKYPDTEGKYSLQIHTLEGEMLASPGDMIICGVNGEIYPCKPDIFAKTYEPV